MVFSQSLLTLNMIEGFLKRDRVMQQNCRSKWTKGEDYFRIDGSVCSDDRNRIVELFNDPSNKRGRLILISTRAGGVGINLVCREFLVCQQLGLSYNAIRWVLIVPSSSTLRGIRPTTCKLFIAFIAMDKRNKSSFTVLQLTGQWRARSTSGRFRSNLYRCVLVSATATC